MDQPCKAAKPARGQLNGEIKGPCRCIRGKYINVLVQYCCLCLFIYQVHFKFGGMYIRARFTAVYAYMCNYSGMYVELCLYVRPSQPGKVANPARGQLAEQGK